MDVLKRKIGHVYFCPFKAMKEYPGKNPGCDK